MDQQYGGLGREFFQGKEASPFVEQRRVTEDCLHLPATLAELKQAPLCSFFSCCWCFRRLLTPSAAWTRLIWLILTCRSKCSRSSICTVLPLDMVENWISLCQPFSGSFSSRYRPDRPPSPARRLHPST